MQFGELLTAQSFPTRAPAVLKQTYNPLSHTDPWHCRVHTHGFFSRAPACLLLSYAHGLISRASAIFAQTLADIYCSHFSTLRALLLSVLVSHNVLLITLILNLHVLGRQLCRISRSRIRLAILV